MTPKHSFIFSLSWYSQNKFRVKQLNHNSVRHKVQLPRDIQHFLKKKQQKNNSTDTVLLYFAKPFIIFLMKVIVTINDWSSTTNQKTHSGAGKGGGHVGQPAPNDSGIHFYICPNSMRKRHTLGEGAEFLKLLCAWPVSVGHHRKL